MLSILPFFYFPLKCLKVVVCFAGILILILRWEEAVLSRSDTKALLKLWVLCMKRELSCHVIDAFQCLNSLAYYDCKPHK